MLGVVLALLAALAMKNRGRSRSVQALWSFSLISCGFGVLHLLKLSGLCLPVPGASATLAIDASRWVFSSARIFSGLQFVTFAIALLIALFHGPRIIGAATATEGASKKAKAFDWSGEHGKTTG